MILGEYWERGNIYCGMVTTMNIGEGVTKDTPKILSKGLDSWKILIRLGMEELLDNRTLLAKLLEIKKHLSESEGVPLALLSYDGIVERRQLESEVQVIVRIIRLPIEKGEPTVHFLEKISPDGIPYSDMEAVMDICPFDSAEQIITLKKVLAVIRQSGIAEDLINQGARPFLDCFLVNPIQRTSELAVLRNGLQRLGRGLIQFVEVLVWDAGVHGRIGFHVP